MMLAVECIYGDPTCPCQDGLACHYVDHPGSPAITPPARLLLVPLQQLVEQLGAGPAWEIMSEVATWSADWWGAHPAPDPRYVFVCPRCGKGSALWRDATEGWCAICKMQTAPPRYPL